MKILRYLLLLTALTVAALSATPQSALASDNPTQGGNISDGWVYPATDQPIKNLCSVRRVLVPNAMAVNGRYVDSTISNSSTAIPLTSGSVSLYFYSTTYVCSNHNTTATESSSATSVSITLKQNGSVYHSQTIGTTGASGADARGGDGGAWYTAAYGGFTVRSGITEICYQMAGTITESPNSYTGLGYCATVDFPQPAWELVLDPSQANPTSGSAGVTVKYDHFIKNIGPDHSRNWTYTTYEEDFNASGTRISVIKIASNTNESGSANLASGVAIVRSNNSTIPSSWPANYKRCQFIDVNPYKSPGPAGVKRSEKACFTVKAAGQPEVTLNCNVSGGTYTLSGRATDPDKAGPLTLEFKKGGSTINTGVTSTGSTGFFSVNVTSFMGSPAATSVFTVTAKGINTSGAQASPDGSDTATCNVAPITTGGGSFCPGDVKIAGNTHVDVALPDQTPSGRTAAPSGLTTNQYATYQQYVSNNKTTVTGINDISSGGARISVSAVPGSESYQNVKLEYKSYVTGMPYDPNQASVTYTSEYKRTDWYVVFDHYECNGSPSASLSGNRCYYSYSAPSYQACSSGWYDSSSGQCMTYIGSPTVCGTGQYSSGGSCYKSSDGSYVGPAGCSSGTLRYGSCYSTSSSYTVYYCYYYNSGEYRSGTTCYGSYNATAYYRWVNNGTNTTTNSNTVNAYAMSACFDRNFRVRDVSANASFNDPEDPSVVSTSGSTNVDFIVPSGFPAAPNGLRTPVRVNLSYTANPCPALSGNFTVNGGGLPSSGSSPLGSGNCPVSAPPLKAGDTVCITYTVSPGQGRVRIDGTPVGAGGSVSVSGTDCTSPLVNAPYVHILGQDAFAGGTFANGMNDQCTSGGMSGGSLRANYKTTGPLTRGSGSQYGAMAQGIINGFASGTLKTSAPTAEQGLTFANAGTTGNLGMRHCVPDYFSTRPASVSSLSSGDLNQFNGAGKSGAYSFAGDLTLTRPGSGVGAGIQKGNRITIYVDGDVLINKNIEFKKIGWASEEDIPSLYVIAKGDIFISPDVTVLDGVYVAQPNGGSGGTINTCASGFGRFSAASLYESCKDNKLMVNGAFVAQTINFLRTFSSLRTSLGGERPVSNDNAGPCDGNVRTGSRPASDTNHDCAAEIINFSPETYLSEPSMLPVGGPAVGKYDYITSLSPVL